MIYEVKHRDRNIAADATRGPHSLESNIYNQSVGFHHMQLNESSVQLFQCFDNQSLLIYKWNYKGMSGFISDIQKPFKYLNLWHT